MRGKRRRKPPLPAPKDTNVTRQVSREIFAAYLDETLGYLPVIRAGLERYCADPAANAEDVAQAYRLTHIIRGASAMVGLHDISRAANRVEEILDRLSTNSRPLDEETLVLLLTDFELIEAELIVLADAHGAEADAREEIVGLSEPDMMPNEPDMTFSEADAMLSEPDAPEFSFDDLASSTYVISDAPPAVAEEVIATDEQIDPDMLEVFMLEAEDHLRIITNALTTLEAAPENYEALGEIRRSTHTLKGAAGVVGLRTLSHVAHRMEDALDQLFDGNLRPSADLTSLLLRSTDILESLAHGTAPANLRTQIDEVSDALAFVLDASPVAGDEPHAALSDFDEAPAAPEETQDEVRAVADESANDAAARPVRQAKRVVRVPLDRLDSLVKLVGELVINRTELERHLLRLTHEVGELQHSTDRLRRVSAKIESDYEANSFRGNRHATSANFDVRVLIGTGANAASAFFTSAPAAESADLHGFDELEFDRYTEFHRLTRELAETTSDASSVQNELDDLLAEFDGVLLRQRRLTVEVQESLTRVRMVPLGTLAARLARAVRLAAEAEGKAVDLHVTGESIELDTTVLDAMADPLLHILRNGVSHGVSTLR